MATKRQVKTLLDLAMANKDSPHYVADAEQNTRRVLGGRAAQAAGASFEAIIGEQLGELVRAGRAKIFKTSPPTQVIGVNEDGSLNIVYLEGGPPDYVGVADGRPVALEAKSTRLVDTWSVPLDRYHQYDFMVDYLYCAPTALVGYLIRWTMRHEIRFHGLAGFTYRREDGILLRDNDLWSILRSRK
jgi:hypothetical protein